MNTQKLFEFTFKQMQKLDKKEINTDTAFAFAKLAQQANNTIRLDCDRTRIKIDIKRFKLDVELKEL